MILYFLEVLLRFTFFTFFSQSKKRDFWRFCFVSYVFSNYDRYVTDHTAVTHAWNASLCQSTIFYHSNNLPISTIGLYALRLFKKWQNLEYGGDNENVEVFLDYRRAHGVYRHSKHWNANAAVNDEYEVIQKLNSWIDQPPSILGKDIYRHLPPH